jgi:hypothetical protein
LICKNFLINFVSDKLFNNREKILALCTKCINFIILAIFQILNPVQDPVKIEKSSVRIQDQDPAKILILNNPVFSKIFSVRIQDQDPVFKSCGILKKS